MALYNVLLPAAALRAEHHSRGGNFRTGKRNPGLKIFFQNAISLLTGRDRHFYNHSRNWWWVAVRWRKSLRGRELTKLRLQTGSEGGLYGNEEGWQDQEESACKEESRQEEKVSSVSLIEAIH
jgi:hypothetical protein